MRIAIWHVCFLIAYWKLKSLEEFEIATIAWKWAFEYSFDFYESLLYITVACVRNGRWEFFNHITSLSLLCDSPTGTTLVRGWWFCNFCCRLCEVSNINFTDNYPPLSGDLPHNQRGLYLQPFVINVWDIHSCSMCKNCIHVIYL